ncbi:MAG: hypothetical protein IT356_08140 [Gemmatimonadaceae bacterium]|nr:hypothetical protein [Gemmatimonadaceae bacterium]
MIERTHALPYLLRHRVIATPNEVWAMDITYIPMARGFLFLSLMQASPVGIHVFLH